MTKAATVSPRPELSEAQRALLQKRLQQARKATGDPHDVSNGIPRRGVRENVPLSYAQQRLWFIDQLEPGSPVYNMCEAVRLTGTLNVAALERSLNEIIRRHEALRTNFVSVDGSPVQVIAEHRSVSLTAHDLFAFAGDSREARLDQVLREEARRPFDLRYDPLLRVLLIRLGPEEHVFMFTMHHIISDGWSLGVFFDELTSLYEVAVAGDTGALPELPLQYADYVLWEKERLQGPVLNREMEYWKNKLRGRLPVLDLPVDHTRPPGALSRGGTKTLPLPLTLSLKLKALSQESGTTLFMTTLAAFEALLHRYTGEEDVVVGSVVAGRTQAALEKLIGFFVNTLVIRENLSGDPSFRELLARTQETTLEALAHQELPFAKLVEELHPDRSASGNPLFRVMFVFQNAPSRPVRLPGLNVQRQDVETGAAKFDLLLYMTETADGLVATVEYNADLFEGATMTRMLGHLHMMLEGITDDPDRKISELPLLTPAERHQLLVEWNGTETLYPRDKTIDELFVEQAALTPHAIAVVCEDGLLTYRELDERSDRLAGRLRQCGVGPDILVGVCLERSIELIVALVAIIKAGGAYVALDPAAPVERLSFMLGESKAPVLLTVTKLEKAVTGMLEKAGCEHGLLPPTVIRLDATLLSRFDPLKPADAPRLNPDNLAYVSYTSGSTGKPKGVCVPHRGVVRLVKDTNFARFEDSDVFLQFAPIAFDASTLEIWAPLLNGGRLVVFPPVSLSLTELGECIQKNRITVLWLTAGLFHQMVEEHLGYLKNVRMLLAGGDVLSVPLVERTLEQLPRTLLINGYGPTENTTFTCCHHIRSPLSETRSVPIGRPIANTHVYVLEAHRPPGPAGVPGELYTGGDGLARGYLHQPELTAEKFCTQSFGDGPDIRMYKTGDRVRWLPDGSLEFLGRIDRQVKIRGYRVEPAEVEAVLLEHPAVRSCAVVVDNDPSGGKRLVACIVTQPEASSTTADWAGYLQGRLPAYLIPSMFLSFDALPLSANGKVDHAVLLGAIGERPESAESVTAPRDEWERQLVGIWETVLGVSPIGVHDRFFELGGHSLLAVRLLAKIETTFGRKLPVSAVFQHPTVAQLAGLLRSEDVGAIRSVTSVVTIQPQGTRPPIYLVHGVGGGMFWGYANLARHLGPDQPVHAFKSRGLDGLPELPSIAEMARSYVADLKAFQPEGPYMLGGYCFGGNVAYEMACQLKEQGDDVALLVLISCSPPHSKYETTRFRWSLVWLYKFLRNVGFWLVSFLIRWDAHERRCFIQWKLRLIRSKLTGLFSGKKADPHQSDVDEMLDLSVVGEDQRRLWDSHMRSMVRHHPRSYDGDAVLLRSAGHLFLSSFDEQCGWGELIRRGVTVKILPGDHGRILEEPFVARMAEELRRCLNERIGDRCQEGVA